LGDVVTNMGKRPLPLPQFATQKQVDMIVAAFNAIDDPQKRALAAARLSVCLRKDLALVAHPRDTDIQRCLELAMTGLVHGGAS
jgi:hypothetical protein